MIWESYAVLANLSASYSPLEGRSPMYSSPVRRFTSVLLHLLARLACIRRAASVRSEPGSNSQIGVLRIWTKGHHFNTPYTFAQLPLFSFQRTTRSSREPCNIQFARSRVKGPTQKSSGSFPLVPHRDSPSGAVIRLERNNHRTMER